MVTEMYELTENGTPLESSFIKPRASSIRSKKDEPVDEQETDSDVEMLTPIPVPSVEGWLQPYKFALNFLPGLIKALFFAVYISSQTKKLLNFFDCS